MNLTDKTKDEFDKWLEIQCESEGDFHHYMIKTKLQFSDLTDSMQIGVLILYFDSVGIFIFIELLRSGEWGVYLKGKSIMCKSREQAWTKAIEHADKIRNEQLNK